MLRLGPLLVLVAGSVVLYLAVVASSAPPAPASSGGREALRYLAVGGGPTPESTEVSLEQNLALAQQVLPEPGLVLFAGGADSRSVRVLDRGASDQLRVRLGDFFQPRGGRDSSYRKPALSAEPASRERVETRLLRALRRGKQPLILFLTTHGEQAEQRRDNYVPLWGGGALSAARLAELHDAHPRPLRVVATGCYSGGFAELAFQDADVAQGPARAPRCGLFAGPWDRETSGCDPDPERRNQEGYSLHFLNALALQDRQGRALVIERLDLDGDRRVGLLEAHTRARIESASLDVPTTTSERYLRSLGVPPAEPDPELLPEEAAVLEQLGRRLGLHTAKAVGARWQLLDRQLAGLEQELQAAEQELQERYWPLASRLLARWPVIDDAYHPDFASTLAREGEAIARALDDWPQARDYQNAAARLSKLDGRYVSLLLREAQVSRLLRARETLELAAGLRRRGGAEYGHYRRLLACERQPP